MSSEALFNDSFNTPAKKLYKRLIQIGANPIAPRGDGDDQHYLGVDGALDPWLREFWKNALLLYPLPPNLEVISSKVLPPPQYVIKFLDECPSVEFIRQSSDINFATVKENRRITGSSHFQDVRHIVLETEQNYNAGDILVIQPRNISGKVQDAIDYLSWNEIADNPIQVSVNETAYPSIKMILNSNSRFATTL